MSFEAVSVRHATFVLWGIPSIPDVDRLRDSLKRHAARTGGPILYLARVPVNAPAPASDVRRYLDARMPDLLACCSGYHVILEGDGIVNALKRGVLIGLYQAQPNREKFFVHSTVGSVVKVVPPAMRESAADVIQMARDSGLLTKTLTPSRTPRKREGWLRMTH
jgi:hypothetical protein